MEKPTLFLEELLAPLTQRARARQLTDGQWADRAGVRKETLSRLRKRSDCDLSTLQALALGVDATLAIRSDLGPTTSDGHFPRDIHRDAESRLLALAASESLSPDDWRAEGPPFFMAGLAVMLASEPGHDRRRLLDLAEQLHPGASEPAVFNLWLQRSPLRPSRFLPMLAMAHRHAA